MMREVERIVLETSLKPFMSVDQLDVEQVCREALRQWYPLTKLARECAILFWVADGSEILEWRGCLDDELEWARYIGFANVQARPYAGHATDPRRVAIPYIANPPRITYDDLKRIIATFKRVGSTEFGLDVVAGATFDPGPEFAESRFKFETHPEIMGRGEEANIGTMIWMVRAWSTLRADASPYAGYPDGIPEGTSFGEFLGRQSQSFLSELGFDYIWLSNGFGFSHFGWSPFGEAFDGHTFNRVPYRELAERIMAFWSDFRRECVYPVEVRGTNYSVGIDLASDCVPALEIYEGGFLRTPPPNSPWGALNYDFGLEMVGYMSRIAQLPDGLFPFRYYPNDPWFWQNPWWDLYGREPFDIYVPMSVGRLNGTGIIENPQVIEFLSIDTEKGELDERCALEVIPHVRRAMEKAPDAPGILTWLYPFREYHEIAEQVPEWISAVNLGDWLMRDAINQGLPLNTVLSTDDFPTAMANGSLQQTVIVTPTTILPRTYESLLEEFVANGGRLLLYGPLTQAPPRLRSLVGVELVEGIEGDFTVQSQLQSDEFTVWATERYLRHEALLSGGPLCEIVKGDTEELVTVVQSDESRAYATFRTNAGWRGGGVAWVRGSSSFDVPRPGAKRDYPRSEYWNPGTLVRQVLQAYDITVQQILPGPQTTPAMVFVSRHRNAFWFTGAKADTTVQLRLAMPPGAPVLVQNEALLSEGLATYQLKKSFHEECVAFVKQKETSVISCRQMPPFPTGQERRILITGLIGADVTVYAPIDRWEHAEVLCQGKAVEPLRDDTAGCWRLPNITGTLDLNW